MPRWQFVSYVFDGVLPGVSVDVEELIASRGLGEGQEAVAISQVLGQPFSKAEVDLLKGFVSKLPAGYSAKLGDAFGVAAGEARGGRRAAV